jgi:3-oxoadipate enol-lactonase
MPKIRTGDIETYYEISGQGAPLFFIHGLGSSTRDWEYQEPILKKHFKVITYDVRGHGQTDKPKGPYSIGQFSTDAAELIKALELGPVHLVGVSMGGMIGFQLAIDRPELLKSLTVVNSGPQVIFNKLSEKMMLWTRLFIVKILGMRMVGRKLSREMFPDPGQDEFRQKVINRWAENEKRCYLDSIRALVGWSVVDKLKDIKCPTLEIRGDHDKTPVSVSDEQLALIPGARRIVVVGSRHATPVDQADKFNEVLLEYLNKLST